jgi:hypothetical protein
MAGVSQNTGSVLRLAVHLLLLLNLRKTNAFTPSDASSFPKPPTNPSRNNPSAPIEPEIVSGPLPFLPRTTTTARESAVVVEWERMTELERRIEDGHRYEHDPEVYRSWSCPGSTSNSASAQSRDGAGQDSPGYRSGGGASSRHRAVFCGYRTTPDEYGRLRSASPASDLR